MSIALSIQSLRKTYGETVALDDLSLEVKQGEIFGIIGPNGAGKTTAVECVLGLRQPDGGTVRVLGMDPRNASDRAFYSRIGAQLQDAALPDRITVQEAVTLFRSFYRETADSAILERWGLSNKRDAAFDTLSGGEKQRLFVALALLHNPDLVILDEISTGLDPDARQRTRSLLRDVRGSGTTVILVTHFMDEAEALCDRVAMLDHGRCVALDPPSDLIDRLDASYRVRFDTPSPVDTASLRAMQNVHTVTSDGHTVRARGTDELLSDVVRFLSEREITPTGLHAERATLEDVFLSVADDARDSTVSSNSTIRSTRPDAAPS